MPESGSDFFKQMIPYQERLVHIAFTQLGDIDDARDAVQDVLVKASEKYSQFEARSQVYTWLVRILINHCYDIHRKNRRRKAKEAPGRTDGAENAIPDERVNLQKKIELSEVSKHLIAAVNTLSEIYRSPVLLRYFENMSYAEIASTLRITEGTIKSRLNQARKILRAELEKRGLGEEYFAG